MNRGGLSTLNKALLDTDTLLEIGKGINPTIARHAASYRRAFGHYTLSTISVLEIVSGHRRKQSLHRIASFFASIAHQEVISFNGDEAERRDVFRAIWPAIVKRSIWPIR